MNDLGGLASDFLAACARRNILAATAESCTGGMIISALTDIAGSSSVVDRSFITYSNDAKAEMLGVSRSTLKTYGAVSERTAREMALGALMRSNAAIALAVTGIAGPDGGTPDKPVGLVWFGLALAGDRLTAEKRQFENRGRDFIRRETVRHALTMGLEVLADPYATRP